MAEVLDPAQETLILSQVARRLEEQFGHQTLSLLDFCEQTFSGYQRPPHIEMVARELTNIERGENDRLVIELPPRHGKSILVSTRFPAWFLCRHPDTSVISASYGDLLAQELGRVTRNVVDTQTIYPKVRLAADSKAKNLWHTNMGGQFLAVGIGSGVVGFGGRVLVLDDPFKKREEAESAIQREHIWNWYTSEILTRQEPDAAIVIVMHRWHEDDLVGRVLADDPGRWKVLRFPALAEANDPLGRKEGDPLWPERYDKETLLRRREEVGERDWVSLYQQRPAPPEGSVFKWFPTYGDLPRMQQVVIPIDTAYGGEDYTAFAAWGWDGQHALLLEADRFLGEAPEASRRAAFFAHKIKKQYANCAVKILYRRNVAIDRIAAQYLRQETKLPVTEVNLPVRTSKEELGGIVSSYFESGAALTPTFTPWLGAWLEEHKGFPTAAHDDWVETTIIGLWYLFRGSGPFRRPKPKKFWRE